MMEAPFLSTWLLDTKSMGYLCSQMVHNNCILPDLGLSQEKSQKALDAPYIYQQDMSRRHPEVCIPELPLDAILSLIYSMNGSCQSLVASRSRVSQQDYTYLW